MGDKYLKRSEQMRGDYDKANKEAVEARRNFEKQQQDFQAAIEATVCRASKENQSEIAAATGLDSTKRSKWSTSSWRNNCND